MKVMICPNSNTAWQNGMLIAACADKHDLNINVISHRFGCALIAKEIEVERPDWAFVTGAWTYSADQLRTMKDQGVKICLWDADGLRLDKNKRREKIADLIDVVISSSYATKFWYETFVGSRSYFLPQFYDTDFCRPTVRPCPSNPQKDVVFIGHAAAQSKREKWLWDLVQEFPSIEIFGTMPCLTPVVHQVYGHDMANAYVMSKIAIDIPRGDCSVVDYQVSDRIYKSMGCGVMTLIGPVMNIDRVFVSGKHLATYDGTYDDLVDKIHFYLANERIRKRIAVAGQAEVLLKHTLDVRLRQYWQVMFENM